MKTAAVLIDSWKLTIFKKHLDAAGFVFTEGAGVTKDTLTLKVEFDWVARLQPIIEAANAECANVKK
jgi:hypothetical protein